MATISTNPEPKPFPLLQLPPELWIRIVKEAVKAPRELYLPDRGDNPRPLAAIVQQPSITRTSRAIRHETLPHFYHCNTFVYQDHGTTGEPLLRWLWRVSRCEWGPRCRIVVETAFPNAVSFFEDRLHRARLPFRCVYDGVVEDQRFDGGGLASRYRIELCWNVDEITGTV